MAKNLLRSDRTANTLLANVQSICNLIGREEYILVVFYCPSQYCTFELYF